MLCVYTPGVYTGFERGGGLHIGRTCALLEKKEFVLCSFVFSSYGEQTYSVTCASG